MTAETPQALYRRQFFVPEADNTLGGFNRPEESLKGLAAEGLPLLERSGADPIVCIQTPS